MKFLKDMDLYKGIILVSLLLLPAIGWWIWSLDKAIAVTDAAITEATRKNGILQQIGSLQEKVQLVVANNTITGDAVSRPGTYFDYQIKEVNREKINSNDFQITTLDASTTKIGGKQQVTDYHQKITLGRTGRDMPVSMEFLYALLFNCESGARADAGDKSKIQSIWKLRQLSFENVAHAQLAKKTPKEAEIPDSWIVREMVFARREPKKD